MTAAIFGLIGVLVGGLLTGGIEAFQGWRSRARQSRVAARVLFDDMWTSQQVIESGLDHRLWWEPPLKMQTEGWQRYRDHLAAAMRADDWHTLAGAFSRLTTLQTTRDGLQRGELDDEDMSALRQDVQWAEKALGVLLICGHSKRELRQLEKNRLDEEAGALPDSG